MKKFLLNGWVIVAAFFLGFFFLFFGMFGDIFYEAIPHTVVDMEIHYQNGSKNRVYEVGYLEIERNHRKKWVRCCSMESYLNTEIGDLYEDVRSRDGPIATVRTITIASGISLLLYFCIAAAVWMTEYG